MGEAILIHREPDEGSGIVLCTKEYADDCLVHYRTPGSKNGVRRWQYEDGSLTPEGYIHYGVGQGNKKAQKAEKYERKAEKANLKYGKAMLVRDKITAKRATANVKAATSERAAAKELKYRDILNSTLPKTMKAKLKADKYKLKAEKLHLAAERQEEKGMKKAAKDREKEQKRVERQKEADDFDGNNTPDPETFKKDLDERVKSKLNELKSKPNTDAGQNESKDKSPDVPESRPKTDDDRNDAKDDAPDAPDKRESHKKFLNSFDDASDEDRKKIVDNVMDVLDRMDPSKETTQPWTKEDDDTFDWFSGRVNKKSGIVCGSFKVGSKAEKVYERMGELYDRICDREEELKKSDQRAAKAYRISDGGKRAKALYELRRNDPVIKELDALCQKLEPELVGAVLEDIGFPNTPEYRDRIFDYVFMD